MCTNSHPYFLEKPRATNTATSARQYRTPVLNRTFSSLPSPTRPLFTPHHSISSHQPIPPHRTELHSTPQCVTTSICLSSAHLTSPPLICHKMILALSTRQQAGFSSWLSKSNGKRSRLNGKRRTSKSLSGASLVEKESVIEKQAQTIRWLRERVRQPRPASLTLTHDDHQRNLSGCLQSNAYLHTGCGC